MSEASWVDVLVLAAQLAWLDAQVAEQVAEIEPALYGRDGYASE